MKQITTILLAGTAALFMTACGGGSGGSSSDGGTTQPPVTQPPVNPPVEVPDGDGSIDNPYKVSNGIHSYVQSAYFKFSFDKEGCNVLVYDFVNSYYKTLFDGNYNEIPEEDDLQSFANLESGDYLLKTGTWHNNADGSLVGVYSPCMNSSYVPDNVQVGLNTFSVEERNHLYKFIISDTSTVTVNRVSGTDYIYFYDSAMKNIYKDYGDHHVIQLEPGIHYLLVGKFAYETEDVVFSFAIDE